MNAKATQLCLTKMLMNNQVKVMSAHRANEQIQISTKSR